MLNRILLGYLFFFTATATGLAEEQQLRLAVPFTDHAILQREVKVPIWGFDKPGTRVTVEFADQRVEAVADNRGDWSAELDHLVASGKGRDLIVRNDRNETITLSDVLVGEVWFSSGQSNMVWLANQSLCRNLAKEIARSATDIPVREINIDTVSALHPQKEGTSEKGWKTGRAAGEFSALSLAFAYELYQELNVPIGIVLSAHSNTRIEAFAQREAIEQHPDLSEDARMIREADPATTEGQSAYAAYCQALKEWETSAAEATEAVAKIPARPTLPGIAGMWRGPSQFFNGKINPVVPYAIRGAIWCQGTSNSGDGRMYAARMEALVNGWRDAWNMPEMPFYFTQMQCYGTPDPDSVGFADIRQVQHQFFMNNRNNVGMVVQSDLNPSRPQGIHYQNKLHPGMRLARWALAKQYGKEIPYTGPIYSGYRVEGSNIVVSFEPGSLFGGLMVGSKGNEQDFGPEGKYVEPAQPMPSALLNHFRLCGADLRWYAAKAVIQDDEVIVHCEKVPEPHGVQYAYNAAPIDSNLYNLAGLPATPFAAIDGQLILEEDDLEKAAALKARYARYTDPNYPILQVVEYFRDGAILQRNQTIPVWGHANEGVEVTVKLGDLTRKTVANRFQQWSVEFPPLAASTSPISLSVTSSHGFERSVNDILVGDVWYLMGSTQLTSEMAFRPGDDVQPLPWVREFRRKTKASTFQTPRKRQFETGGGKYRSSWMTADHWEGDRGVTMFGYHFAKSLEREGIPQGFITMSSGQGGRAAQMASPLSWTSFTGVESTQDPAFRERIGALMMQYPGSPIAKQMLEKHTVEVQDFVATWIANTKANRDLSKVAPLAAPPYPEATNQEGIRPDTIPTLAYNWCVSPMTPMAVAGVIWVPSQNNLGYDFSLYAAELEIFGRSLPRTFGKESVPLIYAQPSRSLVAGITRPNLPSATPIEFEQWPQSLKELARQMAESVNSSKTSKD